MNPDSNTSASNSDTTFTNARSTPTAGESRSGEGESEKPAGAGLSESEFLQRQAAEATAAISQVFGEFSKSLRDGVDPKGWTKEHPWAMVAGATVAGFAAAAMFVPSKEDQALRRLAAMERALMPKPASKSAPHDGNDGSEDGGAKDYSKGRSGFMGAIGRQVLEAIKPALLSALTAGITAKASQPNAQPTQPPQGNSDSTSTAASDPSVAI